MSSDPYEQMRDAIVGTQPYYLAEYAGRFCDGIGGALKDHGIDFSKAEFVFDPDPPYELYFEWWFGHVKAGVSIRADPDESEWFVHSEDGGRRTRFRRPVGDDSAKAAEEFLSQLEITLNSGNNTPE